MKNTWDNDVKSTWGNEIELEIMRRINVSVWAYAYEVEDDPLVSDKKFDNECDKINDETDTGNKEMDKFFKNEFDPFTGLWIYKHPNLKGIKNIYEKHFKI